MENKKQLIIIPPMSEPVKKLHEILEGIAGDENVEISLIDDLKELTQFIATTGQCIILASNAKKCATFLQENKSMLMKNHCKTILFTPKEIPAKTLIKFTKVGLTESILESTPPKTFLYKVKLLLRSIKTAKPQDDAEKVVKSLEGNKTAVDESNEVDKIKNESEENVIDLDIAKKRKNDSGEENVVDYGSNLKGKIKPQEEAIDTHWKSDRQKNKSGYVEEENDSVESLDGENTIDMYLRGKNKRTEEVALEEQPRDLKEIYSGPEHEAKRRKSNFQDVVDEGSMKQKKLEGENKAEDEKEQEPSADDLDLLFEEALKKQKKLNDEAQAEEAEKNLAKTLLLEEEKLNPIKTVEVEDLGGHLKGKIAAVVNEEAPVDMTEEKEYDNSELDHKKKKSLELDLEAAAAKKSKKNIEQEEEASGPHESEVDKIDNNMIGDEGTVDKIRTRMEGRSNYKEEEELEGNTNDEDLYGRKKKLLDEEAGEDRKKRPDIVQNEKEKERSKELKLEIDEKELRQKKEVELALDDSDGYSRSKNEELEKDERDLKKKDLDLKTESDRERQLAKKADEEEKEARERDINNVQFNKSQGHTTHNGNVDKIDSFMRGGEARKKEHSWDNLTEKTTKLELILGSKNNNENTLGKGEKVNLGEQTIDYRKLKEEFDQIAIGERASGEGSSRTQGELGLKNNEDEDSFKVIEVDPKALDFAVNIINSIYNKETKPKQILALLGNELLSQYQGISVFFTYKLSEKKLSESYNMFLESSSDKVSTSKKEWWLEKKKDQALFDYYLGKSMSTWRCEEIKKNEEAWEDVELPSWAEQELKTKAVELIFPYFDGIDRMGMAYVYFLDGVEPKNAQALLTLLEMARTVFLDTIERYKIQAIRDVAPEAPSDHNKNVKTEEKKSVLGFLGGLFGKKKAS